MENVSKSLTTIKPKYKYEHWAVCICLGEYVFVQQFADGILARKCYDRIHNLYRENVSTIQLWHQDELIERHNNYILTALNGCMALDSPKT